MPQAPYYYLYAIPMPPMPENYGQGQGAGMPQAPNMVPPQGQGRQMRMRTPEMHQYMQGRPAGQGFMMPEGQGQMMPQYRGQGGPVEMQPQPPVQQ
jgi:hypothetical protein